MIYIALLYGCIFWYEWRYLHRYRRKRRTFSCVMGTMLFTFLCFEVLYVSKDHFSIAQVIELIFDPINNLIVWRAE